MFLENILHPFETTLQHPYLMSQTASWNRSPTFKVNSIEKNTIKTWLSKRLGQKK